MTTMSNSRTQRKSLANEIDRLDGILDGLDEALAGAVADAVRQATGAAVKEAVRLALVEVLSNPDVLALIAGAAQAHAPATAAPASTAAPAPVDSRPTLRDRLGALGDWAGEKVRAARSACAAPPPPGCSACPGWAPGCARCGRSAGSCCWRWASAPAPGWPPTWPAPGSPP